MLTSNEPSPLKSKLNSNPAATSSLPGSLGLANATVTAEPSTAAVGAVNAEANGAALATVKVEVLVTAKPVANAVTVNDAVNAPLSGGTNAKAAPDPLPTMTLSALVTTHSVEKSSYARPGSR